MMKSLNSSSNYTFLLLSAVTGLLLALLISYFIPAEKNTFTERSSSQSGSSHSVKSDSPEPGNKNSPEPGNKNSPEAGKKNHLEAENNHPENIPVAQLTQATTPDSVQPVGTYAPAVNRAAPSVVNIFTRKLIKRNRIAFSNNSLEKLLEQYYPPPSREETNLGSGVIVSSQGHILTNNHVITGAEGIEILLKDGRYLPATIVGRDLETDLALLKIAASNLPIIYFGDSSALQVGDIVLAIGNPFGFGHTVTSGIISGLNRSEFRANYFDNFIQTDAAINPGNSGGALVNTRGELIGINTINVSNNGGSQGIGFAIPASMAREIMYQLITYGEVERGWIGIEAKEITPMLAQQLGNDAIIGSIIIVGILEEGPAQQAGILPGDIITHINGHKIRTAKNAFQLITDIHPGDNAMLQGIRKTQSFQYKVTVSRRPYMSARE